MFLAYFKGFSVTLLSVSLIGCSPLLSVVMAKHPDAACKERTLALHTRHDQLQRDATEQLKPGTPKKAVTKFFEAHGLPVVFTPSEASGEVHVNGCSPKGCGSDDAILGLRVKVNAQGTETGEPVVGGIYTDCL